MASYCRPSCLAEALDLLGQGGRHVVAGCTDYFPTKVGQVPNDDILDITGIESLRNIAQDDTSYRIGALATWSDVVARPLPPAFDGLKAAAREVGGRQIQNVGTVVGNVCNASPAADGMPVLLTLDAQIELASSEGVRTLPLQDFVKGNRQTERRAGEIATAIVIPRRGREARSAFRKLGSRRYLVISIVALAVLLEVDETGLVAEARVAVGACSAVAMRLPSLERDLVGLPLDGNLGQAVKASHMAALSPIDDIRASAAYRRTSAHILTRDVLSQIGSSR